MTFQADPFAHHPELRDKIIDPQKSFFRTFKPADLDEHMKTRGLPSHWRLSDADREAARKETLTGHLDDDLWVFAYGSLMWDPAFRFAEVRQADITGYQRHFCLKDELGGRGSREAPGLMAALDEGPGCTGLAFRIARDHLDEETQILWRREMLSGVYLSVFVDATTAEGSMKAVTFVANNRASRIRRDISRSDQVRYIATGTGFLGSSLEYIENLASHLTALGIEDKEVFSLLAEAKNFADSHRDPD
jgi:cation transport protein ChaC